MAPFQPTHFVELSQEDVEVWQKAIECFPSQMSKEEIKSFAYDVAQTYGQICGVRYAQPFIQAHYPRVDFFGNIKQYIKDEYRNASPEVIGLSE